MMGFPYLVARANDFALAHLQLDRGTTDALQQRGAASLGDLIALIGSERHPSEECETALTALETLARVSGTDGPDWYAYWKARGFELHQMHLTCRELEAFDVESPVCAVNKESFGNAGVMLARAGYDSLGSLAAGLRSGVRDIPGMGSKKQDEFFRRLLFVVRSLRDGELTPEELAEQFPIALDASEDTVGGESGETKYDFNEDVLNLGIGILHLRAKTKLLEAAGYRTVGDIGSARRADLLRLPSMGRATLARIAFALRSLFEAQGDSGQIDWDRYCAAIDIPLLPAEHMTMDGNAFAAMVGTTLGQLGRTLHDPVLQKIISERISRPPRQRATLEEIGSSLPEPVTRERIRQREAKLLEALAAALVNDDYAQLNVHFRPEFAAYWKRAAEHFDDASEEITFAALVDGLIDTWGTDRAVLLEHLPLIATVITGEIMSSSSFGDATRLDPRLLTLPEADRDIPLRHLQIGRSARALRRRGVETIRDLILRIRQGKISRASGAHYRTAIEHLDLVAASLDANHRLNWSKYFKITGAGCLPSTDPATPKEFFKSLSTDVSTIIAANPPTGRSREIFDLRTARPISTRLTMEKVAEALKTYGPSVKREETYTLSYLNEVIIEGDHSLAGIGLRPVFVRMWQRINQVFDEANGDAELFQRFLAAAFDVEEEDVEPAMPTMIAVLTGYPYGRLARYTRMVPEPTLDDEEAPEAEEPTKDVGPIRIKLKGFRRAH